MDDTIPIVLLFSYVWMVNRHALIGTPLVYGKYWCMIWKLTDIVVTDGFVILWLGSEDIGGVGWFSTGVLLNNDKLLI